MSTTPSSRLDQPLSQVVLLCRCERRPVAIYGNYVGIVAEYNPLHYGHLHHIRRTKDETGADGIVVALSSYFTQRGEPALLSKWDRAESALQAGANLVLELPVFFSCHNAGVFAAGAVDILAATGLVRTLSFGMEEPDFDVAPLLAILVHEPVTFKDTLKKYLNSGFSYVKARAEALASFSPEYGAFVSSPNNSLALAYMVHIARRGYGIRCISVQRTGGGYHDTALAASDGRPFFASASAIRRGLEKEGFEAVESAIPPSTGSVLRRSLEQGRFVLSKDILWRIARATLLRTPKETLALSSEMREGMENRMLRFSEECGSWDEFVGKCVTGRYTRGRVQRQLMHMLLGIGHDENRAFQAHGPAYIHPLAADEIGVEILRKMRKTSRLPLRGKLPLRARWPEGRLAFLESSAAALWEGLAPTLDPGAEKKRHLITGQGCAEGGNAL